MGTTYKVTYQSNISATKITSKIDSLLGAINQDVSTYIPNSFISKINQSETGSVPEVSNGHFWPNMSRAQYWYQNSKGYLDVSIMPMINYWGFGYTPKKAITKQDEQKMDSLMQFVGLDKWNISVSNKTIIKNYQGQQLDFSSLAKGYAVDQLGFLLSKLDIDNYLIDIGGELIGHGVNRKGSAWIIGINRPTSTAALDDAISLLKIDNVALASSGNYRNFYEVDGQKYGHTIDPFSGHPFQDQLLQISVISTTCMDADAIATACMAMGYDKAATFIDQLDNVSACFFVGQPDGNIEIKYTNGFIRYTIDTEKEPF